MQHTIKPSGARPSAATALIALAALSGGFGFACTQPAVASEPTTATPRSTASAPIKPMPTRKAAASAASPTATVAPLERVGCQPTLTSGVAGVSLKTRAARITDMDTVNALTRPLRQLAASQGASLSRVEVLGWGSDGMDKPLTDARATALMTEVKASLRGAGFDYDQPAVSRQTGSTSVTLLTASNEPSGEVLMGFWIRTEHALLLAWGKVEPGSADADPLAPDETLKAPHRLPDPTLASYRH